MTWTPLPRPDWFTELNDLGRRAPGGPAGLVPLVADDLVDTARAASGLDDFGDAAYRQRLDALVDSLESEADLHLVGRLIVRSEILRFLENRLALTALWDARPDIGDTPVTAPVFVTGMGRSGTSILHELLAIDPRNRAPLTWEMLYPVPEPETHSGNADPRPGIGHDSVTFWDVLAPEFRTMHASGGDLPNECIYITAHEFASDYFGGQYNVPSYQVAMAGEDLVPIYEAHKRFLQVLGTGKRRRRWIMKAPSHIRMLPALFEVYPDARVVITHRDPLQVLASVVSLLGTLRWIRSDDLDMDDLASQIAGGFQIILALVDDWRADGTIPDEQVIDVSYTDLVGDPAAALASLYAELGWDFGDGDAARVVDHLASRSRGRHGAHVYAFADTGLDCDATRAGFATYQRRHQVESEI